MMLYEQMIHVVDKMFGQKKILVLGDLMVDEYVLGKVSRISPEAPVPVLNFHEKTMEAGGASNVANNLSSLGAKVSIVGVAADDMAGRWIRAHLRENGVDIEGIVDDGKSTILKTRYASRGQQLLRVDQETDACVSENFRDGVMSYLEEKVDEVDAIVLSDYKKGVLQDMKFVSEVIHFCTGHHILIGVDSKNRSISAFRDADFVKPNNLELAEAVGIRITDDESLDRAGKIYLERSGARNLIVTRGARGISVFKAGGAKREDFQAQEAQVFDVTGAGDTVISTVVLGLSCGLTIEEAVQLANIAASIVIEKRGTVPIKKEELLQRIDERKNCIG